MNVTSQVSESNGETQAAITLANPGSHVAFFVRAEVTQGTDGEEILPITYDDNYITIFPHATRTIQAKFSTSAADVRAPALRIEGYNVGKMIYALK